jgi:hypothetical protein
VLLSAFGEFRLRAVTHLEVSMADAMVAAEVIRKVARALAA